MFKKITLLFLFTGIFSLQAVELPKPAFFLDLKDGVQEFCDGISTIFPQLVPAKPITDELVQFKFLNFRRYIFWRSHEALTAIVFYNNQQELEPLKNLFEQQKIAYLVSANISKTDQEIKNTFNITTQPIIIYYKKGKEVKRNTNFDSNHIIQYISQYKTKAPLKAPIFSELENRTQEFYNYFIKDYSELPELSKFLPKKSINDELTQIRYMSFIQAILTRSLCGITAVIFYDNANQENLIEHLKDLFKNEKDFYLLAADISKTDQEIKDIFKITKQTIIYYRGVWQIARTTHFDNLASLHDILRDKFLKNYKTWLKDENQRGL